jgi:hypothetical protein
MSSPPSLPQLPWSNGEWEQCRLTWQAAEQEAPARRLQRRHHLLRPLLQEALRSLAARHYLLFDDASLRFDAVLHLEDRSSLPEQQAVCQIHLESIFLKLIKRDERAKLSDLRDPMAPWHALRLRVNDERRSFRRYFLAFLPRFKNSTAVEREPTREPNQYWAELWERLTADIPAGCIPTSWHAVRKLVPEEAIEVETDYGNRLFLPPKRDWKELLAKPLHRAAALMESRRPGLIGLHLPDGVIPESPQRFAEELQRTVDRIGGIPNSDECLRAAIEQTLEWQSKPAPRAYSICPTQLIGQAEELGFDRLKSKSLLGVAQIRSNQPESARLSLEKSLVSCTSNLEIAVVLANIAGLLLSQDDLTEAYSFASQAIAYCPASKIARRNYTIVKARLHQVPLHHIVTNA